MRFHFYKFIIFIIGWVWNAGIFPNWCKINNFTAGDELCTKTVANTENRFNVARLNKIICFFQGYTALHIAAQFNRDDAYDLLIKVYGK